MSIVCNCNPPDAAKFLAGKYRQDKTHLRYYFQPVDYFKPFPGWENVFEQQLDITERQTVFTFECVTTLDECDFFIRPIWNPNSPYYGEATYPTTARKEWIEINFFHFRDLGNSIQDTMLHEIGHLLGLTHPEWWRRWSKMVSGPGVVARMLYGEKWDAHSLRVLRGIYEENK